MKLFKKFVGCLMVFLGALLVLSAVTGTASAQTDITATLSSISGYWDAAKLIAIGVLLFVLGRRVVRKI